MLPINRRAFLAAGLGAVTALRSGAQTKTKRLATDWVPLGKTGVKVTRLAFGTGTNGGRVQRELGQEGFTRLVRHAYDQGIRFFETADTYGGMHDMLGIALKGLPRDSYRLMTKYRTPNQGDPLPKFDNYRRRVAHEVTYGRRLAEAAAAFDPDVMISCNDPLFTKAIGARWCRKTNTPWVFWLQDFFSSGMAIFEVRQSTTRLRSVRSRATVICSWRPAWPTRCSETRRAQSNGCAGHWTSGPTGPTRKRRWHRCSRRRQEGQTPNGSRP